MLVDLESLLYRINKKIDVCYFAIRFRRPYYDYVYIYMSVEKLNKLYKGYIIQIDNEYYIKSELLNEFIDRIVEFYNNNKVFTYKEKDDLSNIVLQFKQFDK